MSLPSYQFNRHSVVWYFCQLIIHPVDAIKKIIEDQVSLKRITVVLAVIGLLRGVIEGIWIYAMQGKIPVFLASLQHPSWYLVNSGPFLICNIPSVHFLWLGVSLCLYTTGRILGGRAKFNDIARIVGIAMVSYVMIGLLNYAYLFVSLPALKLYATSTYSPQIGFGQFVVLSWLLALMFLTGKHLFGLSTGNSLLITPLPVTASLVFFVLSADFFFKVLQWLPGMTRNQIFILANFVYTITVLLFIPIFYVLGRKLEKRLG